MKLRPNDILNKKFNHKMRGYDTTEVDEFMRDAAADYEQMMAENVQLKQRVDGLESELKRYKNIEGTLNNALVLAQKTADDLRVNTQKEIELMARQAKDEMKSDLERESRELEELQKMRNRFSVEFRSLLRSYLDICEGKVIGERSEQSSGE